jgi:ribose transport system permease protein
MTKPPSTTKVAPAIATGAPADPGSAGRARRWPVVNLGLERFSGLWVMAVLTVFFCLWEPDTFRTLRNLRILASSEAITGILTLGLIVSLICGAFDLSVAANMNLSLTLVAWLQADAHLQPALAVILTIASGAAIGVVNAIVITVLKVNPVIGTLGMQSILTAMSYWLSSGNDIVSGLSPGFVSLGRLNPLTMPITVYILAVVAFGVWYLLEYTPVGRYFYALGFNAEACRLAGVPVQRLQWTGLLISGSLASFAGVVLTMQLGAASFGAGTDYLLPAFAAAFLGSTQVRPGRFNVAGTLIALYLLAVGVKGLQLRFSSLPWIGALFEGIALIVAVALAGHASLRRRGRPRRRTPPRDGAVTRLVQSSRSPVVDPKEERA